MPIWGSTTITDFLLENCIRNELEEIESMAIIPDFLKPYIKDPPQEMLDRNVECAAEFALVLRELGMTDSPTRLANRPAMLLNNNFQSHPRIPRGYFDKKDPDGTLWVKNSISGKMIKKQDAGLTSSGVFIHRDKDTFDPQSDTTRRDLIAGLQGEPFRLEKYKDMYFLSHQSLLHMPFDASLFKLSIDLRSLSSIIFENFINFKTNRAQTAVPETAEEILAEMPEFIQYLRLYNTSNHQKVCAYFPNDPYTALHTISIPNDSPIFPGLLIDDGAYCGQNIHVYPYPLISLNQTTSLLWDRNQPLGHGRTALNLRELLGTFPFDFMLLTNTITKVTINKKTVNNEGMLLNHNARVDEMKVSFLMTAPEQTLFDKYTREHHLAALEHKTKAAEASKSGIKFTDLMPVKPSAHEPIYLGLELEVTCKGVNRSDQGHAKLIQDMANSRFGDHAIAKQDGSIGNYGLEIVTVPATLAYHKQMFQDNFFAEPNMFHKRVMALDTCGIHVHISKNAMTASDLRKFIIFINSSQTSKFINDMAGRQANRFCDRVNISSFKGGVDIAASIVKKITQKSIQNGQVRGKLNTARIESSHYDAVNIQNAHTIELRIFKSSNDKNNILRKLEFCESLVKFCRSHAPLQMTVYDYVEFILDKVNKKEYPNIVRWLAAKNYIGHQRKKAKDPKSGEIINKLLHIYSENRIPFPDTVFHKKKENYPAYYEKLLNKDSIKPKNSKRKEA